MKAEVTLFETKIKNRAWQLLNAVLEGTLKKQ